MIVSGVEEAGRGPVIGPMVMAIATMDEKEVYRLENMGVKDSKLLSPAKRDELFEILPEVLKEYKIIIRSPEDVDAALADENMNLNWLEGVTSAELINAVDADQVILDCPSNNIEAYRKYVADRVTKKTKVIAEHKADLNHTIVGAASILAKVTRDRLIEKLKREVVGKDFGSGYPSDPKTKAFLAENWDKFDKGVFRKSWKSYKNVAEAQAQKGLGDF